MQQIVFSCTVWYGPNFTPYLEWGTGLNRRTTERSRTRVLQLINGFLSDGGE